MIGAFIVGMLLIGQNHALENGLARTPPMGWLSWERYRCETDCKKFPNSCINENLYMAMADKIVELGFKDVGYEYINIDDCWMSKKRDPTTGKLVADPKRFPNGIKALADYIHSKGLKLGIYEDFGTKTCGGYPGSEYFMETDADVFAEWNVDMVKFDGCYSNAHDMPIGYPVMEFFLNKTQHPFLFSCEWPLYEIAPHIHHNYPAIRKTCNMWRNYYDVTDSWDSVLSIIKFYGKNEGNFTAFTGPGGWADPDMLVVGDFGLSYDQQKAQFGMWAMFAAPLFMSVDLHTIKPEAVSILKNKEVIAINQDPLGISGRQLFGSPKSVTVWKKLLSDGKCAIAFLNVDNQGRPNSFATSLSDVGLMNSRGYNVTDVFDGIHLGNFKPHSKIDVVVNPTGIVLLKAVPL